MTWYMEDETKKTLQSGRYEKSKTDVTAGVQENKSKHTRGL